ncbi:MAG TPA: TraR/DksA C4-type zinc finger protein [Candidatus Paceibacterota bacterium]|nr:TraR/DksA C4-type zinc finger protein [Candidatus Paceibacterota bacterium]
MRDNIETYRAKLDELLRDVVTELKSVGIHNPENPADWEAVPEGDIEEPDPNDHADVVEGWDERRGIVAALEGRYNSIVAALGRIHDGTYGECVVCGRPIEDERLDANPAARTCIEHREEDALT